MPDKSLDDYLARLDRDHPSGKSRGDRPQYDYHFDHSGYLLKSLRKDK